MAEIVMYTTRYCPYCLRAKALLEQKQAEFTEIAVDNDRALRQEMMDKSGRRTVPQIWIDDLHVGGCDELFTLNYSGQLDRLLAS